MNIANDSRERHTLPPFREKLPGNPITSGRIGVKISENCASTREGQLLLWMICNLTVRLKGVMKQIELVIPHNIHLSKPNFIPFVNVNDDYYLHDIITECAKICSRECKVITSSRSDFEQENDAIILLGHDTETDVTSKFVVRAVSDEWLAYVGKQNWHPRILSTNSINPFGAFSAACISVGDIFKFIGGITEKHGTYASKLCFSSYDFSVKEIDGEEYTVASNPSFPQHVEIGKLYVVGAGAVAHSVCHSLYSTPGITGELIIIDRNSNENGELEVIDDTNLNRYIMASNMDKNKQKGNLLASIMNHKKPSISAIGFDESFEDYVNKNADSYGHILSCVDTNLTRHAIQDQLPKFIHGGSTYEMGIQTSFYDLIRNTQCLKCHNPISLESETDEDVIKRLKSLGSEDIRQESIKAGIDTKQLLQYLEDPKCGTLGNESIQKFAKIKTQTQASVSFVSAMSGFMLAAELIKSKLTSGFQTILNCNPYTDFVFNFWNNSGYTRITKPNENCLCNLGNPSPRMVHASCWN